MNVAIITISYGTNYGNRLQNYAMQELSKKLGLNPSTIQLKADYSLRTNNILYIKIKELVKTIIRYRYELRERANRFNVFNKNFIVWASDLFSDDIAPYEIEEKYDYYIVGSDQVWNANFRDVKANINYFLATFAPPKKRISYAASFGTAKIAEGYEDIFKSELPKFKAISVREQEGVRLVEKCGAKATVVLDPTMMLTTHDWDKIASKPKFVENEPYIVTYFLGGRDEKITEYINSAAQGRRVINLDTEYISKEKIANLAAFTSPPDEFVWLFAHADCILTDSFHGTVFSILYHRPFMVFDRIVDGKKSGMESRIDTLLSTFHLEQCRGNIDNPSEEPIGGDWKEVERILAAEREKSFDFLKKALDLA